MLSRGLLLALFVLLAGCGFHLRQPEDVSPLLAQLFVDNRVSDRSLSDAVKHELSTLDRSMVSESEAGLVLTLFSDQYQKRVLSIGALGKAQEFEIAYRVSYALGRPGEEKTQVREIIHLKRDMSYDVSQALGKSQEEQTIRKELRQQAAELIIRRIQYLALPEKQHPVSPAQEPFGVHELSGAQEPSKVEEPASTQEASSKEEPSSTSTEVPSSTVEP